MKKPTRIQFKEAPKPAGVESLQFHDPRPEVKAAGVDNYGLWIETDVLPTTAGKDAAIFPVSPRPLRNLFGAVVKVCVLER